MLQLLPCIRQSDGAEASEEQMRARASSRRGCCALVFAKKARRSGGYQRRAHSSEGCGVSSWGRSASESGRLCGGPIRSRARAQGRGGRRRRALVLPIFYSLPIAPSDTASAPRSSGAGDGDRVLVHVEPDLPGVGGHGVAPRFPGGRSSAEYAPGAIGGSAAAGGGPDRAAGGAARQNPSADWQAG